MLGLGVYFTSFKDILPEMLYKFSSQFGNMFMYLKVAIIRKPGEHDVTINQRSYIHTMVATCDLTDCTPVSYLASFNLLIAQEDDSGPCDVTSYLSMVCS